MGDAFGDDPDIVIAEKQKPPGRVIDAGIAATGYTPAGYANHAGVGGELACYRSLALYEYQDLGTGKVRDREGVHALQQRGIGDCQFPEVAVVVHGSVRVVILHHHRG